MCHSAFEHSESLYSVMVGWVIVVEIVDVGIGTEWKWYEQFIKVNFGLVRPHLHFSLDYGLIHPRLSSRVSLCEACSNIKFMRVVRLKKGYSEF